MANPQHLEWLLEGVEAWNARRALEDFVPDLSGLELDRLLKKAYQVDRFLRPDLENVNLSQALLPDVSLFKANLTNANLRNATLHESTLVDATLWNADLEAVDLREALARRADLRGTNLRGANLLRANPEDARLVNCDLREADLTDTVFYSAYLSGSDLRGAKLQGTRFGAGSRYIDTNVRGTDLSNTRGLDRRYYGAMKGDRKTILPGRLTTPIDWLSSEVEPPAEPEVKDPLGTGLTIFRSITPAISVRWTEGVLDAQVFLDALDPKPKQFHPPVAPSAQMDLLSSLGQIAGQISESMRVNASENTQRITGDAAGIFDAIQGEVKKPEGAVLSFVIDFNLTMVAALAKDGDYGALSDVDQTYIASFLALGKQWRDANGIIQEITNPLDLSILPEENLETLELKIEDMIGFITEDGGAGFFTPRLMGVTADMSVYPWDKDDPELNRRKRVVAFGALADELYRALSHPPVQLAAGLLTFLGSLASILSLFR